MKRTGFSEKENTLFILLNIFKDSGNLQKDLDNGYFGRLEKSFYSAGDKDKLNL